MSGLVSPQLKDFPFWHWGRTSLKVFSPVLPHRPGLLLQQPLPTIPSWVLGEVAICSQSGSCFLNRNQRASLQSPSSLQLFAPMSSPVFLFIPATFILLSFFLPLSFLPISNFCLEGSMSHRSWEDGFLPQGCNPQHLYTLLPNGLLSKLSLPSRSAHQTSC